MQCSCQPCYINSKRWTAKWHCRFIDFSGCARALWQGPTVCQPNNCRIETTKCGAFIFTNVPMQITIAYTYLSGDFSNKGFRSCSIISFFIVLLVLMYTLWQEIDTKTLGCAVKVFATRTRKTILSITRMLMINQFVSICKLFNTAKQNRHNSRVQELAKFLLARFKSIK